MLQTARSLAKLGHEVIVFHDTARSGQYHGVDYLPTGLFPSMVCSLEHDVLVSWDNPHAFRFADRSRLHVLAIQLNDAQIGIYDYAIDKYFHPSEWHVERFLKLYPEMTKEKCLPRFTNGIDPKRYIKEVEREPHRVIYSSSPDRGLHHLLRMWPEIRQEVPDAELHIFYEMDKWLSIVDSAAQQGVQIVTSEVGKLIKGYKENPPEGVTFRGGVGQAQLAEEQMRSKVLAYPCDPVQPTEGFSMTCLEAITAGCTLITTDADALKELWADAPNTTIIPLPVEDKVWVDTIAKALQDTQEPSEKKVNPHYTWNRIAAQWEKEFVACLTDS